MLVCDFECSERRLVDIYKRYFHLNKSRFLTECSLQYYHLFDYSIYVVVAVVVVVVVVIVIVIVVVVVIVPRQSALSSDV